VRILLYPLSIVFHLLIAIKNFLYDKGWLRSFAFDFPIICVGNLNTGGTGKTPHVEYIIRLLQQNYTVATLSRGYKRRLKGYALATELSQVEDIGDEPKLFKKKYPTTEVCVCEDRVLGVYSLLQDAPDVNVIIMDDGLQHRRIQPGMRIMLSSCQDLFLDDKLLPAGNLREPNSAKKRMHCIIITNCPEDLTQSKKQELINKIKPSASQRIFFTTTVYMPLLPLFPEQRITSTGAFDTCVFAAGIANTKHAIQYLSNMFTHIKSIPFADHHYFTVKDIAYIGKVSEGSCLITTEKDAMRLMEQKENILHAGLSFFILPITIRFLFNEGELFDKRIDSYITAALPAANHT
jgi:tetraacyldisaccharide 4'-kinase